jgi:hypothetical protein
MNPSNATSASVLVSAIQMSCNARSAFACGSLAACSGHSPFCTPNNVAHASSATYMASNHRYSEPQNPHVIELSASSPVSASFAVGGWRRGSEKLQRHESRAGSNAIGKNSSSAERSLAGRWMSNPLGPAFNLTARSRERLFHLVFEPHAGRCYGRRRGYFSSIVADLHRWSAPCRSSTP